ncbi:hypothetical protein IGI04_023873 [Brassica rapa subsp. trilocularis]|uniref:Uncharacterized protein n=1 Tax=Brassica rapa subsp. trilocularis TaxID=1813537 RepID=A0ABQ7M7N8_BRACM|nr:hypothetical protein IGI04_023873 [Brassica rapa subsp. trilocularis]
MTKDLQREPVPLQPEEQESLESHSPIISQYATQHNLHPDQSLQDHTGIVANIGIHTLTDHQSLDHNTPDTTTLPLTTRVSSTTHPTTTTITLTTRVPSTTHMRTPIQPLTMGVSSPF